MHGHDRRWPWFGGCRDASGHPLHARSDTGTRRQPRATGAMGHLLGVTGRKSLFRRHAACLAIPSSARTSAPNPERSSYGSGPVRRSQFSASVQKLGAPRRERFNSLRQHGSAKTRRGLARYAAHVLAPRWVSRFARTTVPATSAGPGRCREPCRESAGRVLPCSRTPASRAASRLPSPLRFCGVHRHSLPTRSRTPDHAR